VLKALKLGSNWQEKLVKWLVAFNFHEEWRLVSFTLIFSAASVCCILWPATLNYVLVGGTLAAIALWRFVGLKHISVVMIGGAAIAASLSTNRLNQLEVVTFKEEQFVSIIGQVEALDYRPAKPTRLIVDVESLVGFKGNVEPKRIRLAVRTSVGTNVRVGRFVKLNAVISPLGGALVPGGYDFGQSARYKAIHADGFAASPITTVDNKEGASVEFKKSIDALRYRLAVELETAMPGQAGALAVALTLGLRHGINDKTSEALRKAGLSHLLAISGLHMGLVAAAAFFVFELLLAAVPVIALRVMPRKLAVVPAWFTALGYLLISGGAISTVRAFIMVSVAMLAILTDRRVLSLRSVALAALVILVVWPESILTIGFQMSFAATAGLVMFYERFGQRLTFWASTNRQSIWLRGIWAIIFIGITSLIAQLSVAPFALYHFQALSIVGIVANIIVLPIISFLVMPLLLLALILASFSKAVFIVWLLQPLLSFIVKIAESMSALEFSVFRILPLSDMEMIFLLLAFLSMLLITSRQIFVPVSVFICAYMLVPPQEVADVLISKSGNVIAERADDRILVHGGRSKSFRIRSWRRYWGDEPFETSGVIQTNGNRSARHYKLNVGVNLVKATSLMTVRQACAFGNMVIIPRRYTRYCKGASLVIENETLEKFGPAGLILGNNQSPKLLWSNPQTD